MGVNQPQQKVFGKALYPSIYEKAGSLYINIATKQDFFNANKRTAWLAMDIFLKVVNFEEDVEALKEYVFT